MLQPDCVKSIVDSYNEKLNQLVDEVTRQTSRAIKAEEEVLRLQKLIEEAHSVVFNRP